MKSESLELLIKEGKLEGIKDTKFDITRNMLKANMPTSKIMEFTGLSKNEIESLK